MQSRRLPEDGGGRMHRWHIRRRLGDGGPEQPSAGLTIRALAVGTIALMLSCGDGAVEPAPPPPAPVATTVAVSPASATLTALEETARFTAEVRDQNGQVMAGAAVAWASSDASVAAVDASGQVTAAANGSATITATVGSVSGTAALTVAQEPDSVSVSPAEATIIALGGTVRLRAEAFDANGHAVANAELGWTSSDAAVVEVDASGLATAAGNGTATIAATAGSASGTAALTVAQEADSVSVSPAEATIIALGGRVRLRAEAFDANGHAVADADFGWESSDASVAMVTASGVMTAGAHGEAAITASADGAEGTAIIRVVELAGVEAYLTQAVQSREHPVPLVAGERALLRVFVTAAHPTIAGIPAVRARFSLNGTEVHVVDIPGTTTSMPTELVEGDLSSSANADIPAEIVQPGLEMSIQIGSSSGTGGARRIPRTGRMALEVYEMPVFDLTLIPFLWSADPDSAILATAAEIAADPEGHQLLEATRILLPIAELDVKAHEPVLTSSNDPSDLFHETHVIRALEGGSGYYWGMMNAAEGPALGWNGTIYATPWPGWIGGGVLPIAHEFGHAMLLRHAPCGNPTLQDPSFPYRDGSIGAWGYDAWGYAGRDGGVLLDPSTHDLMSYCWTQWISDYHFTKALRFRLFGGDAARASAAARARSILLWGGVGADGDPFLEPAFVIDAPALLPDSAGEYRLTGQSAAGRDLFSLDFAMPVVPHSDGRSYFVFALPALPQWADELASVTLSGPGGSFTMDGATDRPMAILRDLRTGQVRGFLRDPHPGTQTAADAVGQAAGQGLGMLFSRGIPGADAWRR